MAKFNTFFPFAAADYSFTNRAIQTAGASNGFVYVFICPADFANGAQVWFNMSVSTNTNTGGQNVAARLYALNGSGNWDSATPLSAQSNLANNTSNFPAGGVAEMFVTLTSALTKGVRYALRIFPNTTFSVSSIGFNAVFSTNVAYTGNVDEYHINAVTISTGTPNLAIGTGVTWYGNRCVRRLLQTSGSTTGTSQIGFKFTLPSGLNYTLNDIVLKGLVLDITGATTGSYTGRILDATGTTTIASSPSVSHANIRIATDVAGNFSFPFTTNPTLTGGTGYIFVVESGLEKTLQFYELQSETDTAQTFNGEVTGLEVVRRNGTSGAFTSQNVLGPPSYQSMPVAQIDAVPVSSGSTTGMLVHTGMAGGIRG